MYKLILIIISIFLLSSCEKVIFEDDIATDNPFKNFEYLWNECDQKYSYFDVKGIDWDAIKVKYEAKLYEGMSDDSLFNVMGDMLNELRDDHVNLKSNFNQSGYDVSQFGQDNFDFRIITDHYLSDRVYYTGPFIHDFIDNGEIGYIRYGAFTGSIDKTNIDFVLNRYKNTKGLILDLRENGGGVSTDVFALLSRFVDSDVTIYYSRIKDGPEHDDFSEPEAVHLHPYDGIRYHKKVIVLVDRGTFSAGSFTSLATKAIPNMVLMGDTTGGGLGSPNGGQLPNGWTYRFSITQTLTLDKSPDYENGVPPDITVLLDWSDLTKDEVIDRAILELQ